jgi:23S rRNA U2552 (ribose-2'-O)-methylase RlmE/FtsJ|tara:strand:+ start:3271 stop:4467 length:1197 start_codon:yes stop_codon:yes gene_type:complete
MLYYLLPDCNHILKSVNIKLKFKVKDEETDVFLSKSIHKYLNNTKELIDQNYKKWDNIKKYTNPYEFIHSCLPHMNYSIAKVKPVSRAFFKLIEIYKHFNILNNYNSLKSFHLAEGPGGFIEATAYMRSNPLDTYYGITLTNDDDYSIPGWKKSEQLFKTYKNIIIEKGRTGNGNLYNIDNYKHMATYYKNSMNVITADGGFDFSGDFSKQENNAFRLLFTQIAYAIVMQKYNGVFILKIFDVFLKSTTQLIYLLNCFYKKVYIVKPNTSRHANSEKYLVCKYFKFSDTSSIYNRFHDILFVLDNMDFDKYEIASILDVELNTYYLSRLNEINSIFTQQQIENILNTIKIIHYQDKSKDKIELMKNQNIKKCIRWCIEHNIPYYNNYTPTNIFLANKS